VQIVLGRGLGLLQPELGDNLTQFGIGQTRADDRAMQIAVEFPELASAMRWRRQNLLHAQRQLTLGGFGQRLWLEREGC
jgi:hypothetical protein